MAESQLARNLRTLRAEKGWSRRTLADRSGTGESSVARVELYGHNPTVSLLQAWADALEVDVTDLFAAPVAADEAAS